MFATMNPWQMLLWIAGLELISIPLFIFTINAIVIGYFKVKEQHQVKIMDGLSAVIKKAGDDLVNKAKDKLTGNKEETVDEH